MEMTTSLQVEHLPDVRRLWALTVEQIRFSPQDS